MTKCKTEKEAKEKLEELKAELRFRFCPLIGRKCVANCMAYYEGDVGQAGVNWMVYKPCCMSPMVTGQIEVL